MKSDLKSLKLSLLLLRLGVFIVMFMWTIDKFINPGHTQKVFEKFYMIPGLGNGVITVIALVQLIFVVCFLLGMKKKWTYGGVLLMHTVSTLSAYAIYFNPFGPKNLLFFAAWPMLAAIFALYLLREDDTLLTINFKAK